MQALGRDDIERASGIGGAHAEGLQAESCKRSKCSNVPKGLNVSAGTGGDCRAENCKAGSANAEREIRKLQDSDVRSASGLGVVSLKDGGAAAGQHLKTDGQSLFGCSAKKLVEQKNGYIEASGNSAG